MSERILDLLEDATTRINDRLDALVSCASHTSKQIFGVREDLEHISVTLKRIVELLEAQAVKPPALERRCYNCGTTHSVDSFCPDEAIRKKHDLST